MAITVKRDLVIGHEYMEDDTSAELTRVYRVDGLNPTSDITDQALIAIDSNDNTIRVPRAGEKHEKMPDMRVRKVRPMSVGNCRTAIKIYVTYYKVRRRLLSVQLLGGTDRTLTNRDVNGKIMFVGYSPPTVRVGSNVNATTVFPNPRGDGQDGNYKFNYVQVPFILPNVSLEITYLENECPFSKWQLYGRKLNSKKWQGCDERTWLCEFIGGEAISPIPNNPDDQPDPQVVTGNAELDYRVRYRFTYSPLPSKLFTKVVDGPGWDPLSIFVDQQTGRTPNDIDPIAGGWPNKPLEDDGTMRGNGFAQHQIYRDIDFNDLDLVTVVF